MAKTKQELEMLKQEYITLSNKLKQLTMEELNIVTGGNDVIWLYEKSFDDCQGGSRQNVIGDWTISGEHNN